jgi:hypothetical protein
MALGRIRLTKAWQPVAMLFLLVTPASWTLAQTLDQLAQDYVVLELAMAEHDPAHVDAYYGPEALREKARAMGWTPLEIAGRAKTLQAQLARYGTQDTAARVAELDRRLTALMTRVDIYEGQHVPFDEETRRLFAAVAPDYDAAHFSKILEQIETLLPGEGSLSERVNTFRDRFNVPDERLEAVFSAAMEECRRRTREHIALPEGESFVVEYVQDKPWGGYNWYQGNAASLIQVNVDLPVAIDRAVDLGCHEGYPGHHTYNALLERNLVDGRGWLEYSLCPLFSPMSLIAEGSANYGIRLAFPGDERVQFEREVLFPLAGLDAADADRYYDLQALIAELSYARNEVARDYLNGDISREEAVDWLVEYALQSPERADKSLRFIETYRSYVINYNLGRDLVADFVEREGADEDTRWRRFIKILSEPTSAADLK